MITAIRIEGLRGIRSGAIDGLSPLTVLVGPNGSGKSTLLEAMLIGAGGAIGDAVGRAISRRVELWGGARWLFWRGGRSEEPIATVHLDLSDGPARDVTLRLLPDVSSANEDKLTRRGARPPYVEIESTLTRGAQKLVARTAVAYGDNAYVFTQEGSRELKEGRVRFVDPRPGGNHALLWKSFTEVVEDGLLGDTEALVREVVPALDRLLILTDDVGTGVLHLGLKDHSVPVALAGDGIQTLVQVSLAVARQPGNTVLIEEPEATQHPRSIYQAARAIAASVRRGVQIILSTHSLDLIDGLMAHLGDDLVPLTVHHVACRDGELRAVRYDGREVELARSVIGEDLR